MFLGDLKPFDLKKLEEAITLWFCRLPNYYGGGGGTFTFDILTPKTKGVIF